MQKKIQLYVIFFLTFLLSACSLLYELLIAQTVSFLASNTVAWYSLTLGLYLIAMGLGANYCNNFKRKKDFLFLLLFKVEIALSLLGAGSVALIYFAHMLFGFLWNNRFNFPLGDEVVFQVLGSGIFFLIILFIIMAIGFLSGIELPLLIRMANRLSSKKGMTNRILAVDYFGALLGAIAFPLALKPSFELLTISLLVAFLNLFGAFLLLLIFRPDKGVASLRRSAYALLIVFVFCIIHLQGIHQYFLKKYYFYYTHKNIFSLFFGKEPFPDVERYHSPYQSIDIVNRLHYPNPLTPTLLNLYSAKWREDNKFPRLHTLFMDGDFQLNTDTEEIYHEYFAHIPMIVNKKIPKKILVLGAGDGFLIRELLKYDKILEITHVEIDQKIISLALTHPVLTHINKNSLKDERVDLIVADAYHYIKECREKYDAVYIDFPLPHDYNLSKLYSREFYQFVKRCLKKDGFGVMDAQWIPPEFQQEDLAIKGDKGENISWSIYFNTLRRAGFQTIIPFFSNLETDQVGFYETVVKRIKEIIKEGKHERFQEAYNYMQKHKGEKFVVNQILQKHSQGLQEGFIMFKKERLLMDLAYVDQDVPLFVLNQKRFKKSFLFLDILSKDIEQKRVNSILRPTLPDILLFDSIKLPY